MPNFNRAVITEKGLALNTKANAGQTSILFTKAATGSGIYTEEQDMSKVTAIKEQQQTFNFVKKEIENRHTVVLRVIINNEDLEEGYQIREFGLFAEDPDEGEILYSIATSVEGQADTLPAYSENGLVTMTVDSYVTVSNAENVSITMEEGAYALQEDMDALEGRVDDLEKDVAKNTNTLAGKADRSVLLSVTIPATAWTGDEAPYTNTLAIEGVTATNDISVIPQFTWTAEQAEAWAGAMILSGDQDAGSLTLKAYGDKPMVDLTVTVLIGDEVTKGGE